MAVRRLSARETQVVELICAGSSNKEIAHALSISEQSAKNHVMHIMIKLGARNRTEVAVMAYKGAEVKKGDELCRFMGIPCQYSDCGWWSEKFHTCLLGEALEGVGEYMAKGHSKH